MVSVNVHVLTKIQSMVTKDIEVGSDNTKGQILLYKNYCNFMV